MQLLKKKTPDTVPASTPALASPRSDPDPGVLRDVVVTAIRKDVFIAQGSHLSGRLEAEGNIVTEGSVEGNITATHQVRVDTGGVVRGDIRAAHIIINGLVAGRCHADAVTLLGQGRIEGDVFTDELSVERGGVFIGQSSLPEPGQRPTGPGTNTVAGDRPGHSPVMDVQQKTPVKVKGKETTSAGAAGQPASDPVLCKPEGEA